MASLIQKELFENLEKYDSLPYDGVVLIRDYRVQLTKGGKEYIAGVACSAGGACAKFKVWGNMPAFAKMKAEDYVGQAAACHFRVDGYQGDYSIIIEDIVAARVDDMMVFMEVRYNRDAYWSSLVDACRKLLSDKGFSVVDRVLFSDAALAERFKTEFCASKYHDACLSGLMAHTYKCLILASKLLGQYPAFKEMQDVIVCGVVLHDIGKVKEMEMGVHQPASCLTHMYLGAEIVAAHREFIISQFDEDWYNTLISVIQQHSNGMGGSGGQCRTVAAYVVHLCDLLESRMTMMSELMPKSTDGRIWVDDLSLYI